jgi:hypothetical protein
VVCTQQRQGKTNNRDLQCSEDADGLTGHEEEEEYDAGEVAAGPDVAVFGALEIVENKSVSQLIR